MRIILFIYLASLLLAMGCDPDPISSKEKVDICINGYAYKAYVSYGFNSIPVPLFEDDKPMHCNK